MRFRNALPSVFVVVGVAIFAVCTATAQESEQKRDQEQTADQDRTRDQDRDRERLRDPNAHAQPRDPARDGGTPDVGAASAGNLPAREKVYGWELMTSTEREAHRQAMQNAKTVAERDQLREEHRRQMEDRARQRGVELREPHWMQVQKRKQQQRDPQSAPGSGSGPGMGPGGMGPGGGGKRGGRGN